MLTTHQLMCHEEEKQASFSWLLSECYYNTFGKGNKFIPSVSTLISSFSIDSWTLNALQNQVILVRFRLPFMSYAFRAVTRDR